MSARCHPAGSPGHRLANRRGAVLPLVCILLTGLLAAAALAIDLGRLYYVAAELQTAADAAALAAVSASQRTPDNDSQQAPTRATAAAALNRVAGAAGQVAAADVLPRMYDPSTRTLSTASWTGTVNAVQVTARAQPAYVLAGALGLIPPAMSRTATAWIASVNGANCARPLALPYTRMYEEGISHNSQYTSTGTYAPEYNFAGIASLQPTAPYNNAPVGRTYILLPPGESESTWDNNGYRNSGNWAPADLGGANSPTAYTTQIGAAPRSGACAPTVRIGQSLNPITAFSGTTLLTYTATGIVQLCNMAGNAPNAYCYDARGRVGAQTRVVLADRIPGSNGAYTLKARELSVVRVMCYWRDPGDICANTPITDGYGRTSTFQLTYNGRTSGYPKGTIAILLDGPASMDITPDVVLGAKPGITQRVVLVK